MKQRWKWTSVCFISAVIMLSGCNQEKTTMQSKTKETAKETKTQKEKEDKKVSFVMVGDILLHDRVYEDAKTGEKTYDFHNMFSKVKPVIEKADLAFVNQETMIGGVELGLSSYPAFNSPVEIADTLKDTGFDVVNMANNHTLDYVDRAIPSSLSYWEKLNIPTIGVNRSLEDQKRIRTIEKNGIKFSFLAYTYGTNGVKPPSDKPWIVNYIDKEKIKEDVERAKKVSDCVVVSMHFGTEYERVPNQEQKELTQYLADLGVNITIGTHPHVLQPPSYIKGKNGNDMFVIYSLGNFLSGQTQVYRATGGIMEVDVHMKKESGKNEITIENPSFYLTYTKSNNFKNTEIVSLKQAPLPNVNEFNAEMENHMKQYIPNLMIKDIK